MPAAPAGVSSLTKRRAAAIVHRVDRLAQQPEQFPGFLGRKALQHLYLGRIDGGLNRGNDLQSFFRNAQFARAPVPVADAAFEASLLNEPVDHTADRRAVIGDQAGKRRLIDPAMALDGDERCILHRRQSVPHSSRLGMKDGDRDLLKPADQVPRRLAELGHIIPPAE